MPRQNISCHPLGGQVEDWQHRDGSLRGLASAAACSLFEAAMEQEAATSAEASAAPAQTRRPPRGAGRCRPIGRLVRPHGGSCDGPIGQRASPPPTIRYSAAPWRYKAAGFASYPSQTAKRSNGLVDGVGVARPGPDSLSKIIDAHTSPRRSARDIAAAHRPRFHRRILPRAKNLA